MAAFLATPAAICHQSDNGWNRVRVECHELVRQARFHINELSGRPAVSPDSPQWFAQMGTVRLPMRDASWRALKGFQARLYAEYRVEAPVLAWNNQPMLRISVQGYNTQADIDSLVAALRRLIS